MKREGAQNTEDYDIWGLLAETEELVAKARILELSKHGLTKEQSHVLRIMTAAGGTMTLNELAAKMLRAHNSVSAIVNRMQKRDLVHRQRTEKSQQYRITVTEKGNKLFSSMPTQSLKLAFATLSSAEKKEFARILKKVGLHTRSLLGLDYTSPF